MIKVLFGNRLRTLRMKKGLSQEAFALKIGMDRTYYSSVENGKRNIALENMYKIARGLEIPMEELFKGIH